MVGAAQALIRRALAALAFAPLAASAQEYAVECGCRDGRPHGAYELRGKGGQVRVVGAFNRGKRAGSFLFWAADGARLAQLPYEDDLLTGMVAVWYPPARAGGEPQQKLEAAYVRGVRAGVTRSWYAGGRERTALRYDNGTLVEARAFSESGGTLSGAEARRLGARDADAEARTVAGLEALVRAHLPRCDAAAGRKT